MVTKPVTVSVDGRVPPGRVAPSGVETGGWNARHGQSFITLHRQW